MGAINSILIPVTFDGVSLPEDQSFPSKLFDTGLDWNAPSNFAVVTYLAKSPVGSIDGKDADALKALQPEIPSYLGIKELPTETYKFFGGEDRVAQLCLFLKTNSFFAMALTPGKGHDGFDLISYDPKEKNPSLYLKLMRTLTGGKGHRVNFSFTKDMKVKSFRIFDDETGKPLFNKYTEMECACSALYNLFFFSSSVHATMHVLHFLMTAGFDNASQHFRQVQLLAEQYDDNIGLKYFEVANLLIAGEQNETAIVTGTKGFGSSQAVRPLLEEVLFAWGKNPSVEAYMNLMFNIPMDKMEEAGILVEFRKHAALIPGYCSEMSAAMKEINATKFATLEENLSSYLGSCGRFQGEIPTVQSWLELMNITGLTHGSTLSNSRLMVIPEVLRWRNVEKDLWDKTDATIATTAMATITGMEPERHVMPSKLGRKRWFRKVYAPQMQAVADKFDAEGRALKVAYMEEVMKRPDFDEVGFILSDYFPDIVDGKQLTMSTYI